MCDDSLLSLAGFQLYKTNECASLDPPRRRLTKCFLMKFKGKWDMETSRNLWGTSDYPWTLSNRFDRSSWEDVVFQYHMRVFTTNPRQRQPGPGLQRSSASLSPKNNLDTTTSQPAQSPSPSPSSPTSSSRPHSIDNPPKSEPDPLYAAVILGAAGYITNS